MKDSGEDTKPDFENNRLYERAAMAEESIEQLKSAYDEINALKTVTKMCKEQLEKKESESVELLEAKDKLEIKLWDEQHQNTLLAQKCSDLADELNEAKGLANALLDDYHDLIRICSAIYKWRKESVKEMINQSTGGNDFEKFKNHLGV